MEAFPTIGNSIYPFSAAAAGFREEEVVGDMDKARLDAIINTFTQKGIENHLNEKVNVTITMYDRFLSAASNCMNFIVGNAENEKKQIMSVSEIEINHWLRRQHKTINDENTQKKITDLKTTFQLLIDNIKNDIIIAEEIKNSYKDKFIDYGWLRTPIGQRA